MGFYVSFYGVSSGFCGNSHTEILWELKFNSHGNPITPSFYSDTNYKAPIKSVLSHTSGMDMNSAHYIHYQT